VIDGQARLELHQGDYFTVAAAKTDFMLIGSDKHNYFDILRTKLAWGTVPVRPNPEGDMSQAEARAETAEHSSEDSHDT
jgi:hypothetical protein